MNEDSKANDLHQIRQMRKKIMEAAFMGNRMDGKTNSKALATVAAPLARHVLRMGEREGLSGEDTMTLLAYHALLHYEALHDKLLEHSLSSLSRPVIFVDGMRN